PLMVTPHPEEKGIFTVLEGNRRITALKLLHTPSLAEKNKPLRKRFESLTEAFKKNPVNMVQCIIFPDKEEAARWIELKHTGENKGIGTVNWNTQQKERFIEKKKGKASLPLQVIEFIKKNSSQDEDTLKTIASIPATNLGRLIGDPDVREALGLKTSHGKLTTNLQKEEVLKGLVKIAKDLIHKDFKVNSIYYKKDREKYIEGLKKDDLPDYSKKAEEHWSLDSPPPTAPANKTINKKTQPSKNTPRSKTLSTNRTVLIPSSCPLNINGAPRINEIYWELRRIKIDDFKNAAAVILRVFLELSANHYIEKNSIETKKNPKKESTLAGKIQAICTFMENKKILTRDRLKGIRMATTSQDSIFSTDTFNAYVHNRHFSPSSILLKETWDNMQEFMQKVWE
ncbi:hypothetical protein KKB58_02710, partial [Patescibacteria group bacterium]|nr:hypothetical protein [Patescibacteria group bacterium]